MKTLMLLVALLIAPPAWATTLTFDFTGTIAFSHGTVDGSFTYESTAAPNAFNVRGLAPNNTYALTAWDFTVTNDFSTLPAFYNSADFPSTVAFSNLLAGNTSEFCVGLCLFSAQPYESLRFVNGEYQLQLEFKIPNALIFREAPPGTLADWGPLHDARNIFVDGGASWFESSRLLGLLTDGAITEGASASVPEPPTGWLLGLGALGLLLAQLQRRLRADHFIE